MNLFSLRRKINLMSEPKPFGRFVLISFVLFFGIVVGVNSVFIYYALHSHPGIIIKNPYEKGLKYDDTIKKAQNQPDIKDIITYKDGVLAWILTDNNDISIDNASVTARMIRPVKDGNDKIFTLDYVGNGRYEAALDLQFKGSWQAHLKAQWDNKEFHAQQSILIN